VRIAMAAEHDILPQDVAAGELAARLADLGDL
jgi:hypothetical protein